MKIGEINEDTIYHLIEEVTVKGVEGLTGRVGCVYPKGEKGYFLRSNLGECACIEGVDGYFFAEVCQS